MKKRLKKYLNLGNLINEEKSPNGLTTAEKAQKEAKKFNTDYYKEVKKKMADYYEPIEADDKIDPVKRNLSDAEQEYVNDFEYAFGLQDYDYDNMPNEKFKERAEMAIKGDSKMGNKTYVGDENGNTEPVWGASSADFGEKLVKQIKQRAEKMNKSNQALIQFGDDIETSKNKTKKRNVAVENRRVTKSTLKEEMINELDNRTYIDTIVVMLRKGQQRRANIMSKNLFRNLMVGDNGDANEIMHSPITSIKLEFVGNELFLVIKTNYAIYHYSVDGDSWEGELSRGARPEVNSRRDAVLLSRIVSVVDPESEYAKPQAYDIIEYNEDIDENRLSEGEHLGKTTQELVELLKRDYPRAMAAFDPSKGGGNEKVYSEFITNADYLAISIENENRGISHKLSNLLREVVTSMNNQDMASGQQNMEWVMHYVQMVENMLLTPTTDKGVGYIHGEKFNENKINKKPIMKRLKFKKQFNGVGNAINLIPESYRTDKKVFEMTDTNETYRMRWEGDSKNGRAVVLQASNKQFVKEDMAKMKKLMGYKSEDTQGNLIGEERVIEEGNFRNFFNNITNMMNESENENGILGEFNRLLGENTKKKNTSNNKITEANYGRMGNRTKAATMIKSAMDSLGLEAIGLNVNNSIYSNGVENVSLMLSDGDVNGAMDEAESVANEIYNESFDVDVNVSESLKRIKKK